MQRGTKWIAAILGAAALLAAAAAFLNNKAAQPAAVGPAQDVELAARVEALAGPPSPLGPLGK